MAELVISAIGLVALESTVDRLFTKVATWRHHGADFEQYSLSLAMAGIAYKRWKRSVRLTDGPVQLATANMSVASEDEVHTVVRLLQAIQLAFEDAEKTTGKYQDIDHQDIPTSDIVVDDLGARANTINQSRQSDATLWQKTRWVFHDEAKLKRLEQTVSTNVDKLVKIFPPAAKDLQERLAAIDLQSIVPPAPASSTASILNTERENLVRIRDTASRVDSMMQVVADQEIPQVGARHLYEEPVIEDSAEAFYGDAINGNDISGRIGSRYVKPVARGNARAQYGDRINMPDFFAARESK